MTEKTLIDETIKNLNQNGFEACFCQTVKDAVEKVLSLIPSGASVGFGGSMSCVDSGLLDKVRSGPYKVIDREKAADSAERRVLMKKCLTADVFLTSFNAVSKNGSVFNIDGNGNRVAASIGGPKRVVYVIGRNKIVEGGVDAAIERIKAKACPPNAARLGLSTPCGVSGRCVGGVGCKSPSRMCKVTAVFERKPTGISAKVILVDEDLGY